MNEDEIQPGRRVRIIGNPERTGLIAPEPCKKTVSGVFMARVHFDGNHVPTWQRASNLEATPTHDDPLEDLRNARIHGLTAFQRILTHEKLSGRLANVIYSMETSNTEFLPYQFKPVLKLLDSPTNSLLIADEVGLGKTIEAGLIWTELRARLGARNLLVICPPHLREKWETELGTRFGVRAEICQALEVYQHLRQLREDPNHSFAIVCSFHGLRPPANWEAQSPDKNPRVAVAHLLTELSADSTPLDLVVVDEAHYMRNRNNRTAELGELVTAAAAHRLFLSATPIHTKNKNLYNLLRLLDPDTFNSEYAFRNILEANAPLVSLRDLLLNPAGSPDEIQEQLRDATLNPFLSDSRVLQSIQNQLTDEPSLLDSPHSRSELAYRVERVNLLGHAINRTRKRDIPGNRVEREVRTVQVKLTEQEREFYDDITELVMRYAEEHNLPPGFLFVMPQRQVSSCMAAAAANWVGHAANEEDEINPDMDGSTSDASDSRPLVDFISQNIQRLANPADLEAFDTKFRKLAKTLNDYWQQNPKEKVVLFSYFRPTLHYLRRRLAAEGIETELLLGGMGETKQHIIDRFRNSSNTRLLLSSEVGSEGLDIEFAKVLINYDLPWNPMTVEQRIGRLDRIGQKADRILIFNFIAEDTIDERIYDRLYMRLNLFRRALGDLEAVLGPIISELTRDLLTHRLSSEQQQERLRQAELAVANGIRIQEELEENAAVLAAYGDFILRQVQASHQMQRWIKAEEIERYMLDFFRKCFPKTDLQGVNPKEHSYDLCLDQDALYEFDRFLRLKNLVGQTRLNTIQRRRLRFDNRSYQHLHPPQTEEIVSQSHPLVRFAASKIRADALSRCVPVAIQLDSQVVSEIFPIGTYVFNVQRWQVVGLRELERLHFIAAPVDPGAPQLDQHQAERLLELAMNHGKDWRDPHLDVDLARIVELVVQLDDVASHEFIRFDQECSDENADRAKIQLTSIDRFEARRLQKLNEVLRTHMDKDRSSLAEATRGQIEKLKERCTLQRRQVEDRGRTEAEYSQICFGVIRVK